MKKIKTKDEAIGAINDALQYLDHCNGLLCNCSDRKKCEQPNDGVHAVSDLLESVKAWMSAQSKPHLVERIATTLKILPSGVRNFSLPALRDLIEPLDSDLAQEISDRICREEYLDNDWLTVPEVASRLSVSEQTVRSLLRSGILTGTRVGVMTWRISNLSFDAYVASRTGGIK